MSERNTHDTFENGGQYEKLAWWLQQVLATPTPEQEQAILPRETGNESEVSFERSYHPQFYQQLPDFAMALLSDDPQATVHYAALLYHLSGCTACHRAYLEIYDALRFAVQPDERTHPSTVSRPLDAVGNTLARMLVHISQLLIDQAEAVLHQAHHDHRNVNAAARSLLQQAMKISSHIPQSALRNRALHDLVRVATLFDTTNGTTGQSPAEQTYGLSLTGAGARSGKRLRRAETPLGPARLSAKQQTIHLQSGSLEGTITQHDGMLELHLHDLKPSLRGHYVVVSVPLGSLIEPVRWVGGNPRAILSGMAVDEQGMLNMPLGRTELHLSNPEERSLLEVTFMRLEVRPPG